MIFRGAKFVPSAPPAWTPKRTLKYVLVRKEWQRVPKAPINNPLAERGVKALASTETSRVPSEVRVRLLGGFELTVDERAIDLPLAAQRVVAFVALQERPVLRAHVAGSLWGGRTEERAGACLRSALWRASHEFALLDAGRTHLSLARRVWLDVTEARQTAQRVLDGHLPPGRCVDALVGELLPGWYEDWLVVERERYRQLCMSALERLSACLRRGGNTALAVNAALAAVQFDPFRETAHRALIQAYLAEGNRLEAVRHYRRLEGILDRELGIRPSEGLDILLEGCLPG